MPLRGGACVLLLLIAALLARRHAVARRLGALFALGAAAYAVCSAPGLHSELRWWTTSILAATGNNVVFRLFAQALLEDDLRYQWCYSGLLVNVVATGLVYGFFLEPEHAAPAVPIKHFLTLQVLTFAALAGVQTLGSWRAICSSGADECGSLS